MHTENEQQEQLNTQPASATETTEATTAGIDLSQLSNEQKEALLAALKADTKNNRQKEREAYESLRAEFLEGVEKNLATVVEQTVAFKEWLDKEVTSFCEVIRQYGHATDEQINFTIKGEGFKVEVNRNRVKAFDERADVAAGRLIDFLNGYIESKDAGKDDPMYQLAMTMLERNKQGSLDYKSISKLYDLETRFNSPEYSEIMRLFKESNVVQRTALNYYFYEMDGMGVWHRIEPSFCRL